MYKSELSMFSSKDNLEEDVILLEHVIQMYWMLNKYAMLFK